MGFFDKVKGFFNADGVKAEITRIESPDFGDTTIKVDYQLESGIEATITSINATFIATVEEEEIEVATNQFTNPIKVKAGENAAQSLTISNINLAKALADKGITDKLSAKKQNATFKVLLEIDVHEAIGMFDPTAEKEVFLKP